MAIIGSFEQAGGSSRERGSRRVKLRKGSEEEEQESNGTTRRN